MPRYTYRVPVVNGEPVKRIKIGKREKVIDYRITPHYHIFVTEKEHKNLEEFLIKVEEE